MALTQEEKDELRRERCDAQYQCRSSWKTILQLRKILKQYETHHYKWCRRFEKADYALAEEEKLVRLPSTGKGKSKTISSIDVTLTKAQIVQIAEELGIDLELEKDEELRFEEE